MLNQMESKVGVKKHGHVAKEALHGELMQLYDTDVFLPIKKQAIQHVEKELPESHACHGKKRDGSLKGRVCSDGRKQRQWHGKHQAASPIVCTDSFALTAATESKEGRGTATAGIKGARLCAKQDDFTVVKFVNEQVYVMCLIDGSHEDCIVAEGSTKVIHLVLNKALHGAAKVDFSWHNLLTDTLA